MEYMSDFRFLVKVIVLALIVLVYAVTAQAHEWYPQECCSDRDCRAVDAPKIEVTTGGYLINGQYVPKESVRPSPDGDWHICELPLTKHILCVFEPKGSV